MTRDLTQHRRKVGTACETAAEQAARRLDIGVGEHRQATRAHREIRPRATVVEVGPRRIPVSAATSATSWVGRPGATRRSSVSNGSQPSRSARSTSSSEAPAFSNRVRRSSRTTGIVSRARSERPLGPSIASAPMISPASESESRDAVEVVTPAHRIGAWAAIRSVLAGVGRGANRRRRIGIVAAVAAGVLITAIVVFTLVEHRNYAGRVLPGVKVDGVSISERNKVAVYDEVARLAVDLEKSPLRVRVDGKLLSADPSLLDVSIDARATAQAAIDAGRTGNPLSQLFGTALRRLRPDRVHLPRRVRRKPPRRHPRRLVGGDLARRGRRRAPLRRHDRHPDPTAHRYRDPARRRPAAACRKCSPGPKRPVVTLPVGTIRPLLSNAAVAAAARRGERVARRQGHPGRRRNAAGGEAGATRGGARHPDRGPPTRCNGRRLPVAYRAQHRSSDSSSHRRSTRHSR